MKPASQSSAFTLVELLTVIAVITLMAGLLGLALREGNSGSALDSAQAVLASQLANARSEAALNQSRAMLVIEADPADDRFLRGVHVAVETAPDSGSWRFTDEGIVLPRGIYFVPGNAGAAGTVFGIDPVWPGTRRSDLAPLAPLTIANDPDNPSGKYLGMSAPLMPAGLADANGAGKLVLASARRTNTSLMFEQPEQIRGVVLGYYGTPILINDGAGFDF